MCLAYLSSAIYKGQFDKKKSISKLLRRFHLLIISYFTTLNSKNGEQGMGSDVMRKFTWWSSPENKSRKSVTELGAYNGHFDQRIYETVSQTTKTHRLLSLQSLCRHFAIY